MNKDLAFQEMIAAIEHADFAELLELAQLGYSAYLESLDELAFEEEYQYRVHGETTTRDDDSSKKD